MTTIHLKIFIACAVLVVGLIFLANCLKIFFTKFSIGYLVITLWALLIMVCFVSDYIELDPKLVVALLVGGAAFLVGFTASKKRQQFLDIFTWKNLKANLLLIAIWVAALLVLSLPLIISLQKKTIIPGHFVSNDSVFHALMSEGFAHTRDVVLGKYYDISYPRAYHSFIYIASKTLSITTNYLLLPLTLVSLSMMVFVAHDVWERFRLKSKVLLVLISLLSVAGFLVTNVAYILFVPQIAVIALVLAAVVAVNDYRLKDHGLFGLASAGLLMVAILSMYGIFSLTVVLIALAWRLAESIWWNRKRLDKLVKKFWNLISPLTIVLVICLALLAVPAVKTTYHIIAGEAAADSTNLLTSWGNIPASAGILSVFHISGIWHPENDYVRELTANHGSFAYLAAIFLLIQVIAIVKGKVNSRLRNSLIQVAIPTFGIVFVILNPYLQYKLLTFLIPIFLICFGVGVYTLFEGKWKVLSVLIVLATLYYAVVFTLPYYKNMDVVTEPQMQELQALDQNYTQKGSTLFLTNEDWAAYFHTQPDDFNPNTQYWPHVYRGSSLDFVIWDTKYQQQNIDYIATKPDLKAQIESLPGKCVTSPFPRYTVYSLKCM
jgi:hypothetical protein